MTAGLLLGLGASVCWAVANVGIQRSTRAVGVLRSLVWSQVFGGGVLAVVAALVDRPTEPWRAATVAWTLAGGVAAALAYCGLFHASSYGRLSIVVPIVSSWALLSTAIGIGLLGEPLRATTLLGACLVVTGVILVVRAAAGDARPDTPGHERGALWAAVAGAVGFGTLIPALDQLAPATGRLGAMVATFALELAIVVPLARARGVGLALPGPGTRALVCAVGALEVAGFACANLGAAVAPLGVVAPAASVSAPLTVVCAWLALGERPGAIAVAGAALTAAGVLLLAR